MEPLCVLDTVGSGCHALVAYCCPHPHLIASPTGWVSIASAGQPRIEVRGLKGAEDLREIYVSSNDISDLIPIADLNNLEVIDLEGKIPDSSFQYSRNKVDKESISQLRRTKLSNLTLDGDPIVGQFESYPISARWFEVTITESSKTRTAVIAKLK
ncbi:hypothetical protein Aperf_G00000074437 [Anoplocephala perfoliata]